MGKLSEIGKDLFDEVRYRLVNMPFPSYKLFVMGRGCGILVGVVGLGIYSCVDKVRNEISEYRSRSPEYGDFKTSVALPPEYGGMKR